MMIAENLKKVKATLNPGVKLVAVSKFHPIAALRQAYDEGQRMFGESHVQEVLIKRQALPEDVEWHFIGHLQTNKVKQLVPFVSLIHSVDSMKLLREIDKQAQKCGRVVDVLLQIHVAAEETKFGFAPEEAMQLLQQDEWRELKHVHITGLMAMATNTEDEKQVESEFEQVHQLFETMKHRFFANDATFNQLSMGMSGDYLLAQKHGSTMVRVGSLIFGERNYGSER